MDDEVLRLIETGNEAYQRHDFVVARRYFEMVEERHFGQYVFIQLAWMYQHGRGGARDVQRTYDCYVAAMDGTEWLTAATHLGAFLLAEGRGEDAVPFLRKATDAGHPPSAMRLYGYLKRTPESPFHFQTEHYLMRAVELGHEFAKRDLALIGLERSHGLVNRARAWIFLWRTGLSGMLLIVRSCGDDPRVN